MNEVGTKRAIYVERVFITTGDVITVLVLIKLTKFSVSVRFRCGCSKLTFVLISSFFAMFKNVVHSLEPVETPSNSASHHAPNYVQRS